MTSKQRAKLRSMATGIDTIFQVGKSEISENMATQISNALEARELIKVHVLDNSPYTPREAAEELAAMVNAEVITVIGKKFVLFRPSVKNPKIDINAL